MVGGFTSVKRSRYGKSRRYCSPLKRITCCGFVLVVSTVMLVFLGEGRQYIFHRVTNRAHAAKDRNKMDLSVDFQSMKMNKDKIYKFHDAGSAYHDTNFTCPVKWVSIACQADIHDFVLRYMYIYNHSSLQYLHSYIAGMDK